MDPISIYYQKKKKDSVSSLIICCLFLTQKDLLISKQKKFLTFCFPKIKVCWYCFCTIRKCFFFFVKGNNRIWKIKNKWKLRKAFQIFISNCLQKFIINRHIHFQFFSPNKFFFKFDIFLLESTTNFNIIKFLLNF